MNTTKNNVRYAGRDQYTVLGDQNDSWYNNRARAYRSKWGRFVSSDPIGYKSGANLYSYVRQNPIIFADPHGTDLHLNGFDIFWCNHNNVTNNTDNPIKGHGNDLDDNNTHGSIPPNGGNANSTTAFGCEIDDVWFCCGANCGFFNVSDEKDCVASCDNGHPAVKCKHWHCEIVGDSETRGMAHAHLKCWEQWDNIDPDPKVQGPPPDSY